MIYNDDIIMAIILEASNEIQSFKMSLKNIHKFFYDISIIPDFSGLFENLLFDTNGQSPFCEELEEILSELQSCDIISSQNLITEEYIIKIKKSDLDSKIFSFDPKVEDLIKKIAAKFSYELKTS